MKTPVRTKRTDREDAHRSDRLRDTPAAQSKRPTR
jgi:hypothetical protein